ncbi:hypothetical protein [Mangrovibacterium marinum]|uniref:hypothetical protein n=1 Tax=Mangrovibacterium marinum TaxID=1639118 RepID=UPI002A18CD75|nr:hypothetical protein [Mangrovibacterium marinum]
MFEGRKFKNDFANKLNACYEDETNGVYATCLRFKQYVQTLKDKIEDDNRRIMSEIKREDEDVARSMLNQEDNVNQLGFFTDMLLQSTVVAIYSYFDIKLAELARICAKHSTKKCSINWYGKKEHTNDNRTPSDFEKHHAFLKNETIPELAGSEELFQQLLKWKNLRLFIVHKNETKFKEIDVNYFRSIGITQSWVSFNNEESVINFIELANRYLTSIVDLVNEKYQLVEYQKI